MPAKRLTVIKIFFFCFQAEDGIRDIGVTGVQTCALLISSRRRHTRYWRDWSSDVCSSDLVTQRTKISEDSAQSRLLAAKAQVDQAKATYGLRISQSQSLRVRAGITGVLQLVPVEEGQNVAIGTNVARVADPKKLKAEVKIAETQAKDIVIGQKATIDTRNGVVIGHVSRIDPSVQNGTVTVDAVFDEPLPPGARADLSVDGTIELENLKDVLYVGRPVHGQTDATISLFKISPDNSEASRVNVKLGRSSVTTMEIISGLQVGDKVILSDMSQWDNVDRIRLK